MNIVSFYSFSWKFLLNQNSPSGNHGVWTAALSNQENVHVNLLEKKNKLFDIVLCVIVRLLFGEDFMLYLGVYCGLFIKLFISSSISPIYLLFPFWIYFMRCNIADLSRNSMTFLSMINTFLCNYSDDWWGINIMYIKSRFYAFMKQRNSRYYFRIHFCQSNMDFWVIP